MSQAFEKYSNDKYQLIDFRTQLKSSSVKKLFEFFIKERTDEESVLVGYVSNIIGKLFEISSSEIMDYLEKNKEQLEGMIKNVEHHSVAKFFVVFLGENFVVKEKKNDIKTEELIKSRNLETSYGKGFDSRSRNKLFRDNAENLFDHQKIEIQDSLKQEKLLLLKDIVIEEIQDFQSKMDRSKSLIITTFKELLKQGRDQPEKTQNVLRVVFEMLGKLLDIVCEEVGVKGVNTYMNRMHR